MSAQLFMNHRVCASGDPAELVLKDCYLFLPEEDEQNMTPPSLLHRFQIPLHRPSPLPRHTHTMNVVFLAQPWARCLAFYPRDTAEPCSREGLRGFCGEAQLCSPSTYHVPRPPARREMLGQRWLNHSPSPGGISVKWQSPTCAPHRNTVLRVHTEDWRRGGGERADSVLGDKGDTWSLRAEEMRLGARVTVTHSKVLWEPTGRRQDLDGSGVLDGEVMVEQGLARGRLFNIYSFPRHFLRSCDVILGKAGAII